MFDVIHFVPIFKRARERLYGGNKVSGMGSRGPSVRASVAVSDANRSASMFAVTERGRVLALVVCFAG